MRAIRLVVLVSTVVLVRPLAHADEGPKDPQTAFWWSAGGTIGAAALIGVGAIVYASFDSGTENPPRLLKVPLHNWGTGIADFGALASGFAPSFGEWYSHKFLTAGLGLRLAGAAVAGLGTVHICGVDANEYGCQAHNNNGLIVLGAIMYGGGVIYDIATAKREARHYNRDASAHAAIAPTALRGATTTGYGLAAVGTF